MRRMRGLAGLASVGAVLLVGATAPPAAMAHPCMSEVAASVGSNLELHTGGNWAGYMPAFEALGHECSEDLSAIEYRSLADTSAAADPVPGVPAGPVVEGAGFDINNLEPLGYSERNVPFSGTGSSVYNSDLAFKDNLVFHGTYEGFRVIDVSDKTRPTQILNYTGCNVGQGDVIVYENLLIRSWDSPNHTNATCAGQLVGAGFEGIHIFDISDPTAPVMVRQLRMAATGNEPGAPTGCGSHTATAVPDPARGFLYIYNGASSGTCNGIDVVRISLEDPTDATFLRRVSHGRSASCHDNNVLMNVGGTGVGYAMCAGGNGLAMYKFDLGLDADAEGGVERPTLLWSKSISATTGHSGSFTYDGEYLIFGHEPGGGSAARCQATSSIQDRTLWFIKPLTGDIAGTMLHPRPQTNRENCTWHNFNVVPTKAGYYATVGSYQSGISVFDFSNPAAAKEIAYADPAPLSETSLILGGDWSTYWHNGYIYESDIRRGLITWKLDLPDGPAKEHLARTNTFALSNPQTQATTYEYDNTAPTISIASPAEGQTVGQNGALVADFDCGDNVEVESCVGSAADGGAVDTGTIGYNTFVVTATDTAGNQTTEEVTFVVNSTDATAPVGGDVPATLALTLGAPAGFGAFTPGVASEYTAGTTATVTSSAGDAALTVSDPSAADAGKLVNGAFALASPVTATATSAGGTAGADGAVGGSDAPTSLLSYGGPVANDAVTITFKQAIAADEPLRTGSYSKTLTFTLSTTAP